MKSKSRIAVWSPMPPIKSGVADSTLELLMELRHCYDIEVFIDAGYHPTSEVTAVFPVYSYTLYDQRYRKRRFKVVLHQLGNSYFHFYQYEPMRQQRNVIVSLHDLTWGKTLFNAYAMRGRYDDLRRDIASMVTTEELMAYDAAEAALHRGDVGLMQVFLDNHYLLNNLIRYSRVQVVRLDIVEELRRLYPDANPYFIRHVPKPLKVDQQSARARLRIHPETFMVGVFGYVAPSKRVEKTIAAFREFWQGHPNSCLVIVGPFYDEAYTQDLRQLIAPLAECVTMTGFVEATEYNAYLAACDVVVGLRWPWSGERSRVVNQAIGAGKPVIITDLPKWSDYPAQFTWRVPVNENEIQMITAALIQLAKSSELLKSASIAAFQWFDGERRFENMVAEYRRVIDGLIAE